MNQSQCRDVQSRLAVGLVWLLIGMLLLGFAQTAVAKSPSTPFPDYAKLVEENADAVVNISTVAQTPQVRSGFPGMPVLPPGPLGDMFREFFNHMPEQRSRPARSLGSGFIISSDGYVITNSHVVENAEEITVRTSNQKEYTAELIGADERTDIALLKIDAKDLPTVTIGDSDKVRVGEWVLAIGEPFGLSHSATHGIVSAVGRDLPSDNYVPFIQTDAPVNPGNSGGPLINANGEVIGVNAQIFTKSGGYMGISFAIPINEAMHVADQLREKGSVTRGYLGVIIQPVTDELARSFGLNNTKGALVAQVQDDSPAERAGIKSGDIIIRFAGKDVERSSQLPLIVGNAVVGKEVDVDVIRDGKKITLKATPDELGTVGFRARGDLDKYGLAAENISDDELARLGLRYGVRITDINRDSPFMGALRSGDVLLEVNRVALHNIDDLVGALNDAAADRPVAVRLLRGRQPLFLAVEIK